MSIPTDQQMKELRYQFDQLMRFVASGQVSQETVAKMLEAQMPVKKRIENIPWAVDCSVALEARDARVVLHHAYGDLRVIHGSLQIDDRILPDFLAGRREDVLPMRIGSTLLLAANLAVYLLWRQHLIPENWWGKTVVMPGTVYEEGGETFVFGLECERTLQCHTCAAGTQRNSPDKVRLLRIPFQRLRKGGMWCVVMPDQ